MFYFLFEIHRRLCQIGKGRDFEVAIVLDRCAAECPLPAALIDPVCQRFFPMCPGGINALGDLERVRVEYKGGNAAKLVPIGIEETVVVNS